MDDTQSISSCYDNNTRLSISSMKNDADDIQSMDVKEEFLKSFEALRTSDEDFPLLFENLIRTCYISLNKNLDVPAMVDLYPNNTLKMQHILNETVELLQNLKELLKNMMDATTITCSVFQCLPLATGKIILLVFTFCKRSESVYGEQVNYLEEQLKNLFQTCHELQLVYLLVMEKHFIFDLSNREELENLIEALKINMEIGEEILNVNLKSMAEQWKTYTTLCQKYSNYLVDTDIADNCTRCLCSLIKSNIESAKMKEIGDKAILRNLKVTSFLIKILINICQVFKFHITKDFCEIFDLLVFMKMHCESYLKIMGKSPEFIQTLHSHFIIGVEPLLNELIYDDAFAVYVINFKAEKYKEDDRLLGYLLVLMSIFSCILQKDDGALRNMWISEYKDGNVVCTVFHILPLCHMWFCYGIELECYFKKGEAARMYSLYDHLLTNTAAIAATFNPDEFLSIEECIYECLLQTDCWKAMFASDLWVILARFGNEELCYDQLIHLKTVFKELCNEKIFHRSPQKVYLSFTIQRLFNTLTDEERTKFFHEYNLENEDNRQLWTLIHISNLPEEKAKLADESQMTRLKSNITELLCSSNYNEQRMTELTTTMQLAATCIFTHQVPKNEVVEVWLKSCLNDRFKCIWEEETEETTTMWFLQFLTALTTLTGSMIFTSAFCNNDLLKILHVISKVNKSCCVALKLSFLNLIEKLAHFTIPDDEYANAVCGEVTNIFIKMLSHCSSVVRNKALSTFLSFCRLTSRENIVVNIVQHDFKLKNMLIDFIKNGMIDTDAKLNWIEELKITTEIVFSHKCLTYDEKLEIDEPVVNIKQISNFELVDIDLLFDYDNEEPVRKKLKADFSETDIIIGRLESDITLLRKMQLTDGQVNRIRALKEKLTSLSH